MRIAVIGTGGREHALAWRLSREGHELVGIPGNPGIALLGRCHAAPMGDVEALARACVDERPDLVVVGPEAPLAAGLADRLRARGLPVFGPSAAAARVEASKAFAKELMEAARVPTARFLTATDERGLEDALAQLGGRVAVKADGLAAGKGVVVCDGVDEAREAGRRLLAQGRLVVEERLEGPELSVIAITDGEHVAVLPPARDHKRLLDGDRGPNTGGMGAVCPVPVAPGLVEDALESVLRPTLRVLAARGTPFCGALYAGLMLTPQGPRVLEFNARFGDPETQAILMALAPSVPLGERLLEAATGKLADAILPTGGAACCVVAASAGYPESARSGDAIELPADLDAVVFHAGTRLDGGRLVTAGGRVLGVTAAGATLDEARSKALAAARRCTFAGAQLRSDIGATT